MKKLFLISLSVIALALVSCGDDNGPEVTITSPSNGASFMIADTFDVTFTATDDVDITAFNIDIPGLGTSNDNVDGDSDTDISGTVSIPTGATAGDFTVTVIATDNDGNTGSDEIEVTIN